MRTVTTIARFAAGDAGPEQLGAVFVEQIDQHPEATYRVSINGGLLPNGEDAEIYTDKIEALEAAVNLVDEIDAAWVDEQEDAALEDTANLPILLRFSDEQSPPT